MFGFEGCEIWVGKRRTVCPAVHDTRSPGKESMKLTPRSGGKER